MRRCHVELRNAMGGEVQTQVTLQLRKMRAKTSWRLLPNTKISFVTIQIYIIKHLVCLFVCPGLPWPYLWTDFETKGAYGLPMTQGWLEKYKISKIEKNIFLKHFPPWMPLQTRRVSVGHRRWPWSEYVKKCLKKQKKWFKKLVAENFLWNNRIAALYLIPLVLKALWL